MCISPLLQEAEPVEFVHPEVMPAFMRAVGPTALTPLALILRRADVAHGDLQAQSLSRGPRPIPAGRFILLLSPLLITGAGTHDWFIGRI